MIRVAEVVRRHERPSPKSWTRTKIFSPNIRYFVAILRFVATSTFFLEIFEQKKCFFFGQNSVFLGQEPHYYIVYIAYNAELNFQSSQKLRICRESSKYRLDENLYGHFCPRRKAANFCHPVGNTYLEEFS